MAAEPRVLNAPAEKPLFQAAFRLTDTDLELLDLVQARYNLPTRVGALRFLLRWWKAKVS